MRRLREYTNGNYSVLLFNNGTKIRILNDGETEYKPEYPESIDLCVSHKCSMGCKYCYANCTKEGKELELMSSHHGKYFLTNIRAGTEVALGGGALSELSWITLNEILTILHFNEAVANVTVNIKEFLKKPGFLTRLRSYQNEKMIYGVGISYGSSDREKEILLEAKKYLKNVVVHTIVGITTQADYEWLAENHFKVLILGYKTKGRGVEYEKDEVAAEWVKNNILNLRNKFSTLSFDCLAVEQLDIKNQVDSETWKNNYMGDDGKFTMFVDLVDLTFAKSSTETKENTYNFSYEYHDADEIFKYLQTIN